ncbi:MAG TPA: protoglobin domain-containing protein [Myxococcota bacterium]
MPRYEDIDQRLAYLDLGEDDRALLADLRPLLESKADGVVASFYRHLLTFGPTRQLLRDPVVKERLLSKQRAYLLSLAPPALDAAYIEDRVRIGELHERIGLEPRWYLGAYALHFSLIAPLVCESAGEDVHRASRTIVALQKLLTFDSQLAMDAYIARRERDLEYMADELAKEGRRLVRDYEAQGVVLRRTTKRAIEAEELASIATLVAGLAHEIGTPMGVIHGHAKMLESAVRGEDAEWRLKTIQEQIGRISRIIQTLLNMARPRTAQRVPVALEPLIETTFSFLTEKLARRGIRIERSFKPAPSISGDPERLQQLFLNLFLNAADAMPDGGVLRVGMEETEDGELEIRVADSGTGIPPEDLERIFNPFFTTKEAGEGNGLGLMVCKGIISDHGGSIGVESMPGEGTEFRISLPIPEGISSLAEAKEA